MAQRWFWKGYLKLSLVTCPVAMSPVVSDSEKVTFHTLNRATGHRIQSHYIDAVTGKPVEDDDQVKGYPRGEDEYVMLEDDELDAVALESTRIIDIDMFVRKDSIEWIWYDVPHFLVPDDKVGEEAFSVIREAMARTGMVGISRLVLYRRERAVMLQPRDKGIILWTLRYGDEVRPEGEYFAGLGGEHVDKQMMEMVTTIIDDRTEKWSAKMMQDPVQDRFLDIIKAKKKGGPKARPKPETEHPSNVINIMDALRKSLGEKPKSGKPR